jgi:alpha-glucoside transport system ATP-binding protein
LKASPVARFLDIDDERINEVPPSKRGIAMVFQSYALYPHMTVYDNMAFGRAHAKDAQRRNRPARSKGRQHPAAWRVSQTLAQGPVRRSAPARCHWPPSVRDPKVFLFDEPLSNLDAALRVDTRIEIAQLNEDMPNHHDLCDP